MKRIISLILVSLLSLSALFCLAGCGAVNKGEVAVLWSGEGKATNPNSLINAMDRAMFIENVVCKYYSGNDDTTQLDDANAALNNGAIMLVVELANPLETKSFIDLAKDKNVPVVFFNCEVNDTLVELFNSYDKCYFVESDKSTIADVQGKLIADYVKANYKDMDENEDRKITYTIHGDVALGDFSLSISKKAADKANELLATEDYQISTFPIFGEKFNLSVEYVNAIDLTNTELILTDDDDLAFDALRKLQAQDYNTDKLVKENFVPIITVDSEKDYKKFVVDGRTGVSEEDLIKDGDDQKTIDAKNEKFKNNKELQDYYKANKYLVDLTSVKESDLKEMVYTTLNVIDSGRLAGSAITDQDGISAAVATIVKNLCQGNDFAKGLVAEPKEGEEPSIVVDGRIVKVRYIAYGI